MALSDNLQGWWCPSLDTAGNGTTTLTDLSGNGNNGTLTNMDAATDWVVDTDNGGVRALEFRAGASRYVAAPSPITATDVGTMACWAKLTSGGFGVVVGDGNAHRPGMAYDATRLFVYWQTTAGFPNVLTTYSQFGQWAHLVWTVSGTNGLFYVNGTLVASSTNITPNATDASFFIGSTPLYSIAAIKRIDSVYLWDRSITADEVTELYNGGRSLNLLATGSGSIAHVLRSIQQQHESVVTL